MNVWEQADLETTLDACLFIIGATLEENSLNFLIVRRHFSDGTGDQELLTQAMS